MFDTLQLLMSTIVKLFIIESVFSRFLTAVLEFLVSCFEYKPERFIADITYV